MLRPDAGIRKPAQLSVGKLELPEGVYHAVHVDGEMREVICYEINHDKFRVRWDTIIDGWQYTVSKWTSERSRIGAVEFAKQERESTRRLLIDLAQTGIELEAKIVQSAGHLA